MPVLVGTSGWQYRDWRGAFYPPGVPQRRWLEYYAGRFGTVENNATFYRLPARATFEGWHERTPSGFVMAVKASRYLTHVRMLRDPAEPVRRLLEAAEGLGDRLGPVLLQLPPTLAADPGRLDDCLARFPAGIRVAVEPRHPSWWTDATREILIARGAALSWADRAGTAMTPLWRTAGWGYIRFHEGTAEPWPRYSGKALRTWARTIAGTWPRDAAVYAYFNNDQGGAAVLDAAAFERFCRQSDEMCHPKLHLYRHVSTGLPGVERRG
ncbi:MAG: DUF72 domain-containing protein [Streptosporangiaceae bacterium]|nr:DUF72 domain-containing protein [Streptosporangiaceae bacterium]